MFAVTAAVVSVAAGSCCLQYVLVNLLYAKCLAANSRQARLAVEHMARFTTRGRDISLGSVARGRERWTPGGCNRSGRSRLLLMSSNKLASGGSAPESCYCDTVATGRDVQRAVSRQVFCVGLMDRPLVASRAYAGEGTDKLGLFSWSVITTGTHGNISFLNLYFQTSRGPSSRLPVNWADICPLDPN